MLNPSFKPMEKAAFSPPVNAASLQGCRGPRTGAGYSGGGRKGQEFLNGAVSRPYR